MCCDTSRHVMIRHLHSPDGPRASMTQYWLMKSEPSAYSWEQLVKDESTYWDGVRNYQARNLMRDEMNIGDMVLFYHSNCKPPHVAGIARVCREAYPDHTAQDSDSKYFDLKATPDNPRWMMVDIESVQAMVEPVSLPDMRINPELEGMLLLQKFCRLSVQTVSVAHFEMICHMGGLSEIPT